MHSQSVGFLAGRPQNDRRGRIPCAFGCWILLVGPLLRRRRYRNRRTPAAPCLSSMIRRRQPCSLEFLVHTLCKKEEEEEAQWLDNG